MVVWNARTASTSSSYLGVFAGMTLTNPHIGSFFFKFYFRQEESMIAGAIDQESVGVILRKRSSADAGPVSSRSRKICYVSTRPAQVCLSCSCLLRGALVRCKRFLMFLLHGKFKGLTICIYRVMDERVATGTKQVSIWCILPFFFLV